MTLIAFGFKKSNEGQKKQGIMMAKLMSAKEAKEFQSFLQTHIFNGKLQRFKPFRGGNSSYCFFAETGGERWVVKIILGKYIPGRLHKYLSENTETYPLLRGIKMDKVFDYQGNTCTLQKNYGKPLPRRRFSSEMTKDIFTAYTQIVDLCTSFEPLSDTYNPYHKAELYETAKQSFSAQKSLHAKVLLWFLNKINPETVVFKKENLRIIHGDFNNNQILLQKEKLSAFIDWDSLRTGYPAEDAWEFIFFNLRHLYMLLTCDYWRHRLIQEVQNTVKYEYKEWETAINGTLISWLYRLSHDYKLKRLMKFMYLYYVSVKALKQLKKMH